MICLELIKKLKKIIYNILLLLKKMSYLSIKITYLDMNIEFPLQLQVFFVKTFVVLDRVEKSLHS